MTRPPPPSTLFPYTTLFRSDYGPSTMDSSKTLIVIAGPTASGKTAAADRKSTRLNSSHVRISYAVFCLEKKSELEQAAGFERGPLDAWFDGKTVVSTPTPQV